MSDDDNEKTERTTYRSDLVQFKKKNKIRKKGRPKKVELLPDDEEARIKQKEKRKHMKKDPLLSQVKDDPDSLEVFDEVMRELARENSSLAYEVKERERKNEDTTPVSSKKVTTLRSLAEVYSKKRSAVIDNTIDFESERFRRLLDFFFSKIRTAAQNANLSEEQIRILFGKISDLFEDDSGWKDEAREHIEKEEV
jgi:hypothetical protein